MYHKPKMLKIENVDVIHSSEFVDAEAATDKHVVVIGGGKSAIDCAVAACKKKAKSVKLITRQVHWPVPRYILDIIPFKWGTYSRLGHFLLPAHWNVTPHQKWWHDALNGTKRFVWGILERVFAWQFSLKTQPKTPLEIDLFNGGQILDYDFRTALQSGDIEMIVSDTTEEHLQNADLVICGTGFEKSYEMFNVHRTDLDIQDDGLWLYKNIIPIDLSNVAFVGSEVSTFNNILTHHLQAQWLANYLTSPGVSKEDMRTHLESERKWKRDWMLFSASRASLIQLHMTEYHDDLCRDMNKPLVKHRWWQSLSPIIARDYA
jgi:dimethylaniline monooxygenase (N-oxide forming)